MTNELTLEMMKLYETHYNDDDDTLGIHLELRNYNFNTGIMKEWV
jgi:hypothetical protein